MDSGSSEKVQRQSWMEMAAGLGSREDQSNPDYFQMLGKRKDEKGSFFNESRKSQKLKLRAEEEEINKEKAKQRELNPELKGEINYEPSTERM